MNKYLKMFIYVFLAHTIISIINLLLFGFEFVLAMSHGIIRLPDYISEDVVIWIMVGINFIISVISYVYVGMKAPKTRNIVFDILTILVPFIIGCLSWTVMFDPEYLIWCFNSSLGIFIMFVYDSLIRYIVAGVPSVLMIIGYIVRFVKER